MARIGHAPVGIRGWGAVAKKRWFGVISLGLCLAWGMTPAWGLPAAAPSPTPAPPRALPGKPVKAKGLPSRAGAPKAREGRAPRTAREPAPLKIRPEEFALPGAAPRYDAKGRYLPTIYIYQETNGEFRILGAAEAKTPPAAPATVGVPAQQAVPVGPGAPAQPQANTGGAPAAPAPAAPQAPPAGGADSPAPAGETGGAGAPDNPGPGAGDSREP